MILRQENAPYAPFCQAMHAEPDFEKFRKHPFELFRLLKRLKKLLEKDENGLVRRGGACIKMATLMAFASPR